jgi:polysaccharide pyruvyl transferase WcaK-like protein
LFSLQHFFNGHDFLVTSGFDDAFRKIEELNQCDYVIIGGGGLVLRGFGRYSALIDGLKPNFGCVGISVEAVHEDNRTFIDTIKAKADFIYVRDLNSQFLLQNQPKVVVGPDLSYLYPFEPIEPTKRESCGVNLRNWHYANVEYGGRLYQWLVYLDRRIPHFQRFYPFQKWQPQKLITSLHKRFKSILPLPLYTESKRKNDVKELQRYFDSVPTSFSPDLFNKTRYLVGMRLHSLIFASQVGIPFLSLSYQPKNVEFCKSIQLDCSVDLFDISRIDNRLEYLREYYSEIRSHLLEFTNQKRKHAWELMNSISRNIRTG